MLLGSRFLQKGTGDKSAHLSFVLTGNHLSDKPVDLFGHLLPRSDLLASLRSLLSRTRSLALLGDLPPIPLWKCPFLCVQ